MNIQDELEDRGYSPKQINEICELIAVADAERAIGYSAEFLRRVFLRVDRDSAVGRALSRGLGFTDDSALARAAADFCVSKQYLGRIQAEIEARLAGGKCAACSIPARPSFAGPSGARRGSED